MSTTLFDRFHPGISIDCVIFGFHENELKVLLLKLKNLGKWALPGGFVQKEKDVDLCAGDILKERTGLDNIFLSQFYLFGDLDRNEPGHAKRLVELNVIAPETQQWLEQRFVSVGYYALVAYAHVKAPTPDYTSEACEWCAINALPDMILDHPKILARAYETLRKELNYHPIGLNLLPKQFTMPELQALYETVLGKPLDRRNFRRRMLGFDILKSTHTRRTGGPHKAPMLYEFDTEKYQQAMLAGLSAGW